MKRITHSEKITVRGLRCDRTPVASLSSKGLLKPSKKITPLRPINREVDQNSNQLIFKSAGLHRIVPEKENRPATKIATTRMSNKNTTALDWKRLKQMGSISSTKSKSTATVSKDLSRSGRTRDGDFKKTLSHMEEKFTSASEELQAAEEELTELRIALINAKRTIEALRVENMRQTEKIKFLTVVKQKPSLETSQAQQTSPFVGKGVSGDNDENEILRVKLEQSKNLQKMVDELREEKMLLDMALENSKSEISRIQLENNHLKNVMEEERKEWDQMQKDLLIAVKVANDFKMEAQKEMTKLSEKITELQKRRQSVALIAPQGSAIALYEEKPESWEDKAWQRLMLGCERGSRRNALLRWCQEAVAKFSHVEVTNFSSSWADGQALCYLLASFYPNKLNVDEICTMKAEECLKLALNIGDEMGVEVKVTVADFRNEDRPEWSLIMRYILNLYYVITDGSGR